MFSSEVTQVSTKNSKKNAAVRWATSILVVRSISASQNTTLSWTGEAAQPFEGNKASERADTRPYRYSNFKIERKEETPTVLDVQRYLCSERCQFEATLSGNVDINVTAFDGYGRTGNAIISILRAMKLAYDCRLTIQLPLNDIYGAFMIQPEHSFFNFHLREGPLVEFCSKVPLPLSERAGYFYRLNKRPGFELLDTSGDYRRMVPAFDSYPCLRKYLGLCEESYCRFPSQSILYDQTSTVVAHVREGDVFFTKGRRAHPGYGQPPLSYYLQAFSDHQKIVIVGEPGDWGPIRQIVDILRDGSAIKATTVLMTNQSWEQDMRFLMCAENLIWSKSTLQTVFNFGFASKTYHFEPCRNPVTFPKHWQAMKSWYRIEVEEKYQPFKKWVNDASQWIAILLHRSKKPVLCPT